MYRYQIALTPEELDLIYGALGDSKGMRGDHAHYNACVRLQEKLSLIVPRSDDVKMGK